MRKKFWSMIVIWIGALVLSCCVGRYHLSVADIGRVLFGFADQEMMVNVFWKIRLPRTFFAATAGCALGLAGFIYQGMFQNPLVSPDVLGVSSGCSVGAVAAILFLGGNMVAVQALSFAGGFLVVVLSVALAYMMGGRRLYSLVLAGIILGALSNAVLMLLKYTADPERQLAVIEYWLMGSFHTVTWPDVRMTAGLVFPVCVLLFFLRWQLKILMLGSEEAVSLGVSVFFVRMAGILGATILTGAVVSVAGVISWVGLIIPHMVRLIFGERYEANFVQSIFCGSIFMLIADILARRISTAEIPISILTSFMGAIFLLLFLFMKRRERRWQYGD